MHRPWADGQVSGVQPPSDLDEAVTSGLTLFYPNRVEMVVDDDYQVELNTCLMVATNLKHRTRCASNKRKDLEECRALFAASAAGAHGVMTKPTRSSKGRFVPKEAPVEKVHGFHACEPDESAMCGCTFTTCFSDWGLGRGLFQLSLGR